MLSLAEQRVDALFAVLLGAALLMALLRVAQAVAARQVARADARAIEGAAARISSNDGGSSLAHGPPMST